MRLVRAFLISVLSGKRLSASSWDKGNSRKSVEKHEVSQAEAEQVSFERATVDR